MQCSPFLRPYRTAQIHTQFLGLETPGYPLASLQDAWCCSVGSHLRCFRTHQTEMGSIGSPTTHQPFHSQPLRYSLRINDAASGAFFTRSFLASHSIRLFKRSATLPNKTASVIGPA